MGNVADNNINRWKWIINPLWEKSWIYLMVENFYVPSDSDSETAKLSSSGLFSDYLRDLFTALNWITNWNFYIKGTNSIMVYGY